MRTTAQPETDPRIASGNHAHTAEVHGEAETLGLRPWARDLVLAAANPLRRERGAS